MSHCTYEALPGHEKNLLRASLVWPSVSLSHRRGSVAVFDRRRVLARTYKAEKFSPLQPMLPVRNRVLSMFPAVATDIDTTLYRDTYSVHAILAASDSVALMWNLIVILEVCGTLRRRTWWPSVF